MTTTQSNGFSTKNVAAEEQSTVTSLLQEAGISTDRFIPVEHDNGHKRPTITGWQSLPQREVSEVGESAGMVCGDGLFVIDVDHPEKLPEEFEELPEAPRVDTLHGGDHYFYATYGEQPESRSTEWGEIQSTGTMVVAPGTVFSHSNCETCSLTGEGQYRFAEQPPIPTVNPEDYPQIFDPEDDIPTQEVSISDTEYDDDAVATMQAHILDFYSDQKTTERARNYLQDLTWGKYAERGFTTDSGDADRSEAEVAFASLLYGVCLKYGDATPEEHLHTVRNYISKSCNETQFTTDGQPRKWSVRGENYKTGILRTVFSGFDRNKWEKWQQRKDQWDTTSNDYSDLTYDFVMKSVQQLSELGDYPTRNEIIKRANEINPGERSDETYREALSALQNVHGQIKMAYLGGNSYVYYSTRYPDPDSAEWVKLHGEKQ